METKITRYGARHWAITEPSGELIAVTVYRRGARRVAELLQKIPRSPRSDKQKTSSEMKFAIEQ